LSGHGQSFSLAKILSFCISVKTSIKEWESALIRNYHTQNFVPVKALSLRTRGKDLPRTNPFFLLNTSYPKKKSILPGYPSPGNIQYCFKKAAKNYWLAIAGKIPALLASHTLPLADGSQP